MSRNNSNNQELSNKRHSLAHLLAAAVMELWPDTKRTIGPAIDDGFYFDFEFSQPISEDDLPKIEKKMREIFPSWSNFERHELTAEQAKAEYPNNPYKHELIDEFTANGSNVSFYKSGDYWDLCKGGHVNDMQEIDAESFKLDRIAGAYWRGDEKNPMLTRIYGLAFDTKQELDQYLEQRQRAENLDHKKLGPQLDLYTFSELVGSGLPLWTPKGTLVRNLLDNRVWELRAARGYQKVEIPHITKKDLYETSGHWDKFKDELFRITTREGHEFAMKPMNCPHHTQIYDRKRWSYRELPQRYANSTMCYRDEQSGELAGLTRVRAFTQDDAHVFCRLSQAKDELTAVWEIVEQFYKPFGFDLKVRLSLRDPKNPDNYLGDDKKWDQAEAILREIATKQNIETLEGLGEAAFYGPKLDFMAKDALGRQWQVATIQLDLNMPERFNLFCINEEGQEERIVMIHAAIMGSIERFLGTLIEHTGGHFPTWLAPVQAMILPIAEAHHDYAHNLAGQIAANWPDARIEIDNRNESVGKRIRETVQQKVPYILVVGDKETESGTVAVRSKDEDRGTIPIEQFIQQFTQEIKNRS